MWLRTIAPQQTENFITPADSDSPGGFHFPGCQGPERRSGSGMLSKLNSMFRRALGNRCECDVAQAQRDKAGDYVIPAEVLRLTIERYMRNMPPAQRDEGSAKA